MVFKPVFHISHYTMNDFPSYNFKELIYNATSLKICYHICNYFCFELPQMKISEHNFPLFLPSLPPIPPSLSSLPSFLPSFQIAIWKWNY